MRIKALFVSVVLLSFIYTHQAHAEDVPYLWSLSEVQTQTQSKDNEVSVSALINNDLIATLSENAKLQIPVPGFIIPAQITSKKQLNGLEVWQARNLVVPGLPNIQIIADDDIVSAWIPTLTGSYRLINGRLVKEHKMGGIKPDYKRIPEQASLEINGIVSETSRNTHSQTASSEPIMSAAATVAGNLSYRVLFVVTPEFISSFPNTEAEIANYVSSNNAIYQSSNMNVTMVNAAIIEANLEPFSPDQILDNLSSASGDDSTDGEISDDILTPIWQARVNNRADFIVVMLNDLPEGLCGQGWLNGDENQIFSYNFAVNVTAAFTTFSGNAQLCGIDTLGHELGHNMGLGHSLKQGSVGTVFEFGRGYGVDDEFTTVMAYPQDFGSAVSRPFFSSPTLTCLNGLACGVDREDAEGADSVYSVNQVKEEISLIHNDELTLPISEALARVEDSQLSQCISDKFPDAVTNEQIGFLTCYNDDNESYVIRTIDGIQNFPKLSTFGISGSDDTTIEFFRNLQNIVQLDTRSLFMTSLRPISHLQDQLRFFQFNQGSLTCQDVKAAESWGIATFSFLGSCITQSDDSDDFDNDGINNLNDPDDDNDGIDDVSDARPRDASNAGDIDDDGVPDEQDAFPYDESESLDTDGDTVGNNTDPDDDNDGVADGQDCAPLDNSLTTDCSSPGSNTAPTITGTPATSVLANSSYSFVPSASDADGDVLTFSIQNTPSWASFATSDGRLSGTPSSSDTGTYSNIVISVSDGEASASLDAFSIEVSGSNSAPTISGSPSTSVQALTQYSFTPTAADADGDQLTFSIVNIPGWAFFDTANGNLSGTPSTSDVGVFRNIGISVSDGNTSAELPIFDIEVTAQQVTEPGEADFTFESQDGLDDFDFTSSNPWALNSSEANTGSGSLASADISNNETSAVTYTNTFIAGDVTFFLKVSSEFNFDFLRFSVDDQVIQSWSGDVDWEQFTHTLEAGEHTLKWEYEKDFSVSDGQDQAWIDDLSVPLSEDVSSPPVASASYVDFDYDGDGFADIAVRRGSNFTQYIKNSSGTDVGSDRGDDIQRVTFGRNATDIPVTGDFDGDGIADVAVRRASNFTWYIKNSSGIDSLTNNSDGITRLVFGRDVDDIPVPADYDGDGKTDVAVRRASNQTWYINNSSGVDMLTDNADGITRLVFGRSVEDIPVPADYDGDGRADPAVRRPSTQFWYVKNSSGIDVLTNNEDGITRRRFGTQEEDIPVPADFDGDGRADLAVRRPSTQFWYVLNSSGGDFNSDRGDGIQRVNFGKQSEDIPIVADYDGDGVADFAVRRPSNQFFYILNSSGTSFNSDRGDNIQRVNFGRQETDIPLAAPVTTRMQHAAAASDDEG